MTLPIDLVLVRHGQSDGNAAKRLSEAGDNSAMIEVFKGRHSSSLRLTAQGRSQALATGKFIISEFFKNSIGFDRYITSVYRRAMETAGLLHLPGAEWFCDFYLSERDWGEIEACPENELEEKFATAVAQKKVDPFFWRPPNGESFSELCLRVDRVLDTLHRECSKKRVLIVCHGEVMRAFQVRIERLSQVDFKRIATSTDRNDSIYNCQIVHYSRRHPETGELMQCPSWVRWIRPTESPAVLSEWRHIERPRYSCSDLLDVVRQDPVL